MRGFINEDLKINQNSKKTAKDVTDFVPKVLNVNIMDEIIVVSDDDAYNMSKRLAKEEGLIVGNSSGAACFAAMKVAAKFGKGKNVVTLFPDTGDRYMTLEKGFK